MSTAVGSLSASALVLAQACPAAAKVQTSARGAFVFNFVNMTSHVRIT